MTSDDYDYDYDPSAFYDDIMQNPFDYATEYQTLMDLRKQYGDTISKAEYMVKLEELSNTVVKEWENDLEYFIEYADGTIFIDEKAEKVRKCGWCNIELTSSEPEELCSSCNKLPKRISDSGPFTDSKMYIKGSSRKDYKINNVDYRYMIADGEE
jgi:hypothetical protein